MRMAFLGEDAVIAIDPPMKEVRGSFLRNDEGHLAWFRIGQVYKHEEP
jgi:hypothetical protein